MSSECPDLHSEELYSEWLAELKSEIAKAGLDVDEAIESSFEFRAAYDDRQKPSETVRDYVMYCAEPVCRTIESAPRDGTRIMIFDDRWYFARWSENANWPRSGEDGDEGPGWQIFDCDDGWYSEATKNATHWMRVPRSPK